MPAVPVIAAVAAVAGAAASIKGARTQGAIGQQSMNIAKDQQGWHDYFNQQLADLMADPSRIKDDPGYKMSLLATQRNAASKGLRHSGAEEAALFDASGSYINQRMQMLASAGGANTVNPGLVQVAQSGAGAQTAGTLQALAGLGYAVGAVNNAYGSGSGYKPPDNPTFDSSGTLFTYGKDPYIQTLPGGR